MEVDTYELRGGTESTKAKGQEAKQFTIEALESDEIYVQTEMDSTGKYGRLLAWVWYRRAKDKNFYCLNRELRIRGFHDEGDIQIGQ